MELETLAQQWRAHQVMLERSLRLDREAVRRLRLRRVETGTWQLGRSLRWQLAINGVAAGLLGNFAGDHLDQPRLAAAALALLAAAVAHLGVDGRQLVALRLIDLEGPIAAVQARLEGLRVLRARLVRWTLLASPLLWVPLLVVVAGALDVDLTSTPLVPWLWANLAFGVAVLAAGLAFGPALESRLARAPALAGLLRDLTGRTLASALEAAEAVARFEREEPSEPTRG
jgi:hypothetical protein